MPLTRRQACELELAHSAANDAVRAVALQRHRVNHGSKDDDAFFGAPGFRQEVDVYFLVLALRWLQEACRLAAELTGDATLALAIGDFERRLPQARDIRDIREHVSATSRVRASCRHRGHGQTSPFRRALSVCVPGSGRTSYRTSRGRGRKSSLMRLYRRPSACIKHSVTRDEATPCVI